MAKLRSLRTDSQRPRKASRNFAVQERDGMVRMILEWTTESAAQRRISMKKPWLLLALATLALASGPALSDDFPQPENHGTGADELPLDSQQAAAGFKLPPGFKANVFAAEPDVQNPVAMAWDTRSRLWVAECYTYGD